MRNDGKMWGKSIIKLTVIAIGTIQNVFIFTYKNYFSITLSAKKKKTNCLWAHYYCSPDLYAFTYLFEHILMEIKNTDDSFKIKPTGKSQFHIFHRIF